MRTSHILTIVLGVTCFSTQAQVVTNTNLTTLPLRAAMGINYPAGGTIPGPANEQPQLNIFSTSRNANVGGEAYINCRREIQNGNGDFFEIQNASGGGPAVPPFTQTSFLPMLTGSAFTHNNPALTLCGNIATAAQDAVNANPIMDFAAVIGYQRLQAAGIAVQNRPLYRWRNNAAILMMMQANGNLGIGIGATVPTARLHTNGFVRHENLDNGTGNVLTVDAQGNILNSGVAFNPNPGIQNACTTVNIVPRVTNVNGNLGCSQIFDDGTSVGINTVGPFGYAGGGVFTAGFPGPQAVRLDVVGLTRSTSFVATSDAKYKTNITPLSNSLEAVLKLNPVEYNWNVDKYQDKGFDHLKHSGFLAQELAEVLPNSVIKDEKGDYAVDYHSIVPVLVQAVQVQKLKLDELAIKLAQKDGVSTSASDVILKDVKLYQNAPNPFNQATEIKYYLPQAVQKAFIAIYDLNGKQLKAYDIQQRGDGSVTVQAEELVAGMYLYSMVVEGREADTKRMVLSK